MSARGQQQEPWENGDYHPQSFRLLGLWSYLPKWLQDRLPRTGDLEGWGEEEREPVLYSVRDP